LLAIAAIRRDRRALADTPLFIDLDETPIPW
jgi:hypothetical protein